MTFLFLCRDSGCCRWIGSILGSLLGGGFDSLGSTDGPLPGEDLIVWSPVGHDKGPLHFRDHLWVRGAVFVQEAGPHRQLECGQAEGVLRKLLGDAVQLKDDLVGLYARDVVVNRTLTFPHAHLCGLLGHGDVGEDTCPETTQPLDFARDGTARGLQLARL